MPSELDRRLDDLRRELAGRLESNRAAVQDHETRLRIIERMQTEQGGRIASLLDWRKDVAPVVADLDDELAARRRRRWIQGVTLREAMALVVAVTAVVLDHVLR